MNKPSHPALTVSKKAKILAKTKDFNLGLQEPHNPSISGQFKLSEDGRFFEGFIDVGEDRLNCVLLPQENPSMLKLQEYVLELPMGTGHIFSIER